MHDRPIIFKKSSTIQIAETVKRIEAVPYPRTQPRVSSPLIAEGTLLEAIVTTTITACNGNTYGQGYAQPVIPTLNSNTNTYIKTNDYTYASLNTNTNSVTNSVFVVNSFTNTNSINTNANILIFWRNGVFCYAGGC